MTHDFNESLTYSHMASDLPMWKVIYKKAFPTMMTMTDHRQDGEHQRAGIDRSITLSNSKQILIDEKVRRKNEITGKIYEDIALEFLSIKEKNIPGWVCKPLRADYIAYAILPLKKCYLLPVLQLQKAWLKYGGIWKRSYKIINAKNYDYTTVSVGVPVNVLFKAIGECLRISF